MNNVQEVAGRRAAPQSRAAQRDRLIACAEATIAAHGFASLRARDLAACAGCSLGGLYNLVADLDELVLLVGQRTMARLDAALAASEVEREAPERLLAWARAYAGFAAGHRNLWRALFEFRMASPRDFPEWFAADQLRIFVRLEACLAPFLPGADAATLRTRACALFAAVHGIVSLGLDEKLIGLPTETVDRELAAFVSIYVDGLRRAG